MDWNEIPRARGNPDFQNFLTVLQKKCPSRPTLFELFLNDTIYLQVVPELKSIPSDPDQQMQMMITANTRLGYDNTNLQVPHISLIPPISRRMERTASLNEGGLPHRRADFEAYHWPDPQQADYDIAERLEAFLPAGMKLVVYGPGGVLENATSLIGFDQLCYLIHDDPGLADDLFAQIGSRLLAYYQRMSHYESVGAFIANDDWGFKTSTVFSPRDMRRYVFPWYERIVASAHAAGKPIFLHSCGYFENIVEDIIETMKFDGRHSYEDNILSVEEAYERYHARLAILGGIDVNFICSAAPEEIYRRSQAMLDRSTSRGGYALGSGNSIPYYVPECAYYAMIRAALDLR